LFIFQTGARAQVGVVVIRVTTLYVSGAGASAAYYTGYLTKADGEQPGVWAGSQAPGLGLSGEVTTEALEALLSGYHPDTGTLLGRELVDRADKHGNTIRAVAGYDATLSAPKSVSVLWGRRRTFRRVPRRGGGGDGGDDRKVRVDHTHPLQRGAFAPGDGWVDDGGVPSIDEPR
jgi:hypothetical protein